jgi:hypothetical protein
LIETTVSKLNAKLSDPGKPKGRGSAAHQPTAQEQPLSKEQIQQIKQLDAEGKQLHEIAKELGVYHVKIANSKVWRSLHPSKQAQTPAAA